MEKLKVEIMILCIRQSKKKIDKSQITSIIRKIACGICRRRFTIRC